ncbi:MAG TPA: CHAD domain-containing protein [Phenylobacterium sp.]|nr:CHAD domain-containing protein [Phenylobacterium sp.]
MASEDREIELKFLCEPRDLDAVLAAAPGEGIQTRTLTSTYFDTPDNALSRGHISLRLRDGGAHRVQTLKRGEGFAREEHEGPAPAKGLDLSVPALKRALTPAQRRSLAPVFTVSVSRRQRTFTHAGAEIELAVDEGAVTSGDRRRTICEVELELMAGPPEALFDLARTLSQTAPLYLSFDGKASQGQALRDGTESSPRKAEKAKLRRGANAADAFQSIARNALTLISANALVLREADGEEVLHQLRVAVRRLRSAISIFKPIAADDMMSTIQGELKWLLGACDEARDLDVFAHDNAALDPAGHAFAPAVEAARAGAHAKACAAVASRRFRDLVLEATAWVETGAWLTTPGKAARKRKGSARDFAVKALAARWKRLLKAGAKFQDLDDEGRHRLRIEGKKLRYSMEAFAPLFDARGSARFLTRLKDLQDQLGLLNDGAVAAKLVERLGPTGEGRAAARRLLAARDARRAKTLKAAAKAMKSLAAANPPWII